MVVPSYSCLWLLLGQHMWWARGAAAGTLPWGGSLGAQWHTRLALSVGEAIGAAHTWVWR